MRLKDQKSDDDFQIQSLQDRLKDSQNQADLLRQRCEDNEKLMEKFSDEVRSLEVLIDRKQREHETLERDNHCLTQELDEFKMRESAYNQTRISLE
jgi:chromosome segregation ATPase